jgi:copper chaperone CopZ
VSNRLSNLRKRVLFVAPALVIVAVGIILTIFQPRAYATPTTAAVKTVVIPVEGMSCLSCAARIKRTLAAMDGVIEVSVDLAKRQARVRYTEGRVTPERLVEAINNIGYRAGTPKAEDS